MSTRTIKWLGEKQINWSQVQYLLQNSQSLDHFANFGPATSQFEEFLRKTLEIEDSKAIIAINNATSALHVIKNAFEIAESRNIIFATQAFTFPSSAQSNMEDTQIVDVDMTGGLDISKIEYIDKIDAIVVTNAFGNLTDINKYCSWFRKNKKFLVFR